MWENEGGQGGLASEIVNRILTELTEFTELEQQSRVK
jgi:hypothetical protein